MIGMIVGDIVGGGFEDKPVRTYKLTLSEGRFAFTCNTVLAAAVCDMLYYCAEPPSGKIERMIRTRESVDMLKKYARLFPETLPPSHAEWAKRLKRSHCIAQADFSPVFSLGCAYAANDLDGALSLTELFCDYICDTDDARSCAKAVNSAVYALRCGTEKETLAECIVGLDLAEKPDRQELDETLSLKRTPEAAVRAGFEAFMRSYDYDSALRYAAAYGAMSATVMAVSGALAGEYYKEIPSELKEKSREKLGAALKTPIERFIEKFETEHR